MGWELDIREKPPPSVTPAKPAPYLDTGAGVQVLYHDKNAASSDFYHESKDLDSRFRGNDGKSLMSRGMPLAARRISLYPN
jgi:hypothetical protein